MAYYILTILLLPVLVIYTLKLAIKFKSFIYLKQRLGFSLPELDGKPVWIHCASVGEVNTFLPLLDKLINELPRQIFVITTNTTTGANALQRHELNNTVHCYLPIENSYLIKKFLKQIQPRLCLIMETEIWPLLYKHITQLNIPLSIINGRLSNKTINTQNWIKNLYRQSLGHVDHILTRSEQDSSLFKELGASEKNIETIGNLKFSQNTFKPPLTLDNFTQRRFVLAASTHEDEELQLAKLWHDTKFKDTLLVIAPRHPIRRKKIINQLKDLNKNISVRSNGDLIDENTDIYLADTLGELTGLMNAASIVFMGGSLIQHGGQNFLEAANLSKAIIFGPHMHNFQNEVDLFKHHHACLQINNINELSIAIQSLLIDNNARTSLESCAGQLMNNQADIADHYLDKIKQYYPGIFKQK